MPYTQHSFTALTDIGKYLDNDKNLLYMPVSQIIYTHTTHSLEYAHHISESFDYALWILNNDKTANKAKAETIINEALKYQCQNSKSPLFGFWNLFAEEDVSELPMPDYGFCCSVALTLLELIEKHNSFLSAATAEKIKTAFLNTLFAIMTNYTPPSPITTLKTIYVSLKGGMLFDNPEYIQYGEQCLRLFYNSVIRNESFITHNDIMFFPNCLQILDMLISISYNDDIKGIFLYMQDLLWGTLARNYHAETKQIAGASTLTPDDFTEQKLYNFLYDATDGKIDVPHTDSASDKSIKCPSEYIPYFEGKKRIEYSLTLVSYGMTFPYFLFSKVASTYMRPEYTFGTYNRELFWLQRRPFIGYFCGKNAPFCFKLQVLHEFCDYISAGLHCLQHYGHSFGHISFLTNKGAKNFLDGTHSKLNTKDLRIRFAIIGDTGELEITRTHNSITVRHETLTIFFEYLYLNISGFKPKIRISEEDNAVYFDAIIYSGQETTINFAAMEQAICGFNFLITSSGKMPFEVKNSISDNELISTVSTTDTRLRLVTPIKPGPEAVCMGYDRQYTNDYTIEEYAIQTAETTKAYTYIEKLNQNHLISLSMPNIDASVSALSRKIDMISKTSFEQMTGHVNSILNTMSHNSYALALQRRMAIQIAVNLLDCAKSVNPKLDEMINYEYSNVFRKIISAESLDSIRKNILKICGMIQKDKIHIESKYLNKKIMNDIFRIISDNLLNPELSLDFVADKLGYSTAHISRFFVKSTGTNYITYVQKEKMNYAIKQLKTKKMSISEVSEKIGYSSPNSFMRAFKKIFGMTVNNYLNSKI